MSAPTTPADPRLAAPDWNAADLDRSRRRRLRALVPVNVALAAWYFVWLLHPERVGNPVLYGVLVAAEVFNLVQATGFWWTALRQRRWRTPPAAVATGDGARSVDVDVLIPVYGEPVHVVEPTVVAASARTGARVHVHQLDDGDDPAMAALAARHGARYLTRDRHTGAKAGNLNAALPRTCSPYVVVFDCDHVARPQFLERTLVHFADPRVAFVQTPQYYANHRAGGVPAAAWAQQALFFGGIARGKDGHGAMFCCGTNVVFRRAALAEAGGFPEDSVTEDFVLSIRLHERGWRSVYHPEVLACGLGPEDMASYVTQQLRWSRGCLGAVGAALRARLSLRRRVQYLLSTMYFLTGWTVLVYMSLPVVRILTGSQPLARLTADQFLLHFAPYFLASLATVSLVGAGAYTFAGFALAAATFWVHVVSSVRVLGRRRGRFAVTAKGAGRDWQPRAVAPTLVTIAVLVGVAGYGLAGGLSPATVNNVAFALLHVFVLAAGIGPALRYRSRRPAAADPYPTERATALRTRTEPA